MKKFNITVIINAVELLMNNFDIKEEAKNVFSSVEYYRDTLMDGMSEDGILEEYVDLFGCADSKVLFDNYITVNVDNVEYNFDEDAADEGQHRDCCFFRVPCSFDLEKYIKYMDQGNAEDAGEDDEIAITVFRDTVDPNFHGDDNLGTLIIKKDILMKYFKERILPDFRGDDKTVSDEGLLQEWLDEYTADATTDLYDFIQLEEKRAKDKEHYQKLYDEKYDKLLEEARNKGCTDPESEANEAFNECATAEEVVGYYITWHGDDAFKDWVENSQFYERERGKIPSEQDRTVTRILGELYDNTVVKGIEWYIPEGTSVNPKLSEVKVVPKATGRTEEECTEAVRLYLQLTYATEPKAFSFMLPDGKMAGYRNWELSSTTKKDDDVGCYGVGSEPCLNGCAGCDRLKRELKFAAPKEMKAYLKDGDAYNPITEAFVSQYNDEGTIIVYTGISVKRARQLAVETYQAGEESWTSVIGPGGAIYEKDFPFDSAADSWIRDNFSKNGWVVADTDTFSNENKVFIHYAWDFDPVDWIVGISGSDMDDVEVKVVHGTTYQLKKQLISEIQNIIADGDPDDWDSGTEEPDEIVVHDDGKMYAYVCFKDCHFDLTATPISVASRIDFSCECAKTA